MKREKAEMTTHQTPRPLHPAIRAATATVTTVALVIFTIILITIIASGTRAGAAESRDCPDPNTRCLSRDNPGFYKRLDAERTYCALTGTWMTAARARKVCR